MVKKLRFTAGGIALLATTLASGATYHVAPGGSDNNSGTESQPWATLQHAAGEVRGGDTVLVHDGTYTPFHVTRSGSASAPIVFRSLNRYGAVVQGSHSYSSHWTSIDVRGDWVTIDGFTVNPAGVTGRLEKGVTCLGWQVYQLGCVVENNIVNAPGGIGIFTAYSTGVVIQNNVTRNAKESHGIYVSNSADEPVVRGNVSHDNYKAGIQLNGDVEQCGGSDPNCDGTISGALIEGNILYHNSAAGNAAINLDGVENAMIRNNLLYDNYGQGITSFRWDGGRPSTGNKLLNNTIIQPSGASPCIRFVDGATGGYLRNNIAIHLGSGQGIYTDSASNSGIDSDYNIVSQLSNWKSGHPGLDEHSFSAPSLDALFSNPGADNYHLKPGGVAVDNGTTLSSVPTDLEGVARPQGTQTDIGAYELGQDTGPIPPPTNLRRIDKK